MKIKQLFILSFLLCAFSAMAQVPNAFNYQSLVRDAQGNPLSNQTLNFEVSIVQNNAVVYGETQSKTTNTFGLVDIKVGQGTVFQGNFAAINWGNGAAMIRVKVNGVVLPESPIVPVPIALYALKSGNSSGGSTTDSWTSVGNNINRVNGNVGIAVQNPTSKLSISGDLSIMNPVDPAISGGRVLHIDHQASILPQTGAGGFRITSAYPHSNGWNNGPNIDVIGYNGNTYFGTDINGNPLGNVGIGTRNPQSKLEVNGNIQTYQLDLKSNGVTWPTMRMLSSTGKTMYWEMPPSGDLYLYDTGDQQYKIYFSKNGNTGIGTTNPRSKLDVNGTASVSVLEVRGADIVEKFNSKETIEAGTLVTIDAQDINNYKTTEKAYQKGIVGIVSGANGVKHGMLLQQDDALAGNTKVAIAGRVYVKATVQNGAIKAGDMLTSSDKAGYAMKATSQRKAFGSVVGKALTSLESGEGFVLVLVGLQ